MKPKSCKIYRLERIARMELTSHKKYVLFMRLTNENLIRIILLITRKLSFINGKNGKQKIAQLNKERNINM